MKLRSENRRVAMKNGKYWLQEQSEMVYNSFRFKHIIKHVIVGIITLGYHAVNVRVTVLDVG